MRRLIALCLFALMGLVTTFAQVKTTLLISEPRENQIISPEIYGQFAEHLGSCIYGGLWVGEKSKIPNLKGYRLDVLEALKQLAIPVLRWPGGCFADEYHWMDGIGPRDKRPSLTNNNWGGTVEDNSFGTNEFLNLCELLGCEPYISGNVGSGSVEEMAKWVEYMTSDADTPMANLRRANGREHPWKVKYFGVGNESWGCGGSMRPAYYSDLFRRYATYCRNFGTNQLFKIASGASDYDYNWTDVLMQNVGRRMNGLSLHYYTIADWNKKGSATAFNSNQFYSTIGKCMEIEKVLQRHIAIMDKYDPKKNIALMVDEWGTWWDEAEGTQKGHLFQQNTMRDAFVAALTFDIFHKYTDRIKMTNIAQVVNVLQSMILTKENKMVLTPTYYVFKMYKNFQGATVLPLQICSEQKKVTSERGDQRIVPFVCATAAKDKKGQIQLALSNIDLENEREIAIQFEKENLTPLSGQLLTSEHISDHNTFDKPNTVKITSFTNFKKTADGITVHMPKASIVVLTIK
ncbi:MAG: alpha-N-arabinofuranosidase [Massilibacteroides sp.]|nr:alpha-N-arabinofuranosidase [Massilibacteroides sp.]